MAIRSAEEISRFLGYLHLDDVLNLDTPHYTGAPTYLQRGFAPDAPLAAELRLEILRPTGGAPARIRHEEPEAGFDRAAVATAAPPILLTPAALPFLPTVVPRPSFGLPDVAFDRAGSVVLLDPSVTYTFGTMPGRVIDAFQRNVLNDDDLVDALLDGLPVHVAPLVGGALEALMETALEAVPGGLQPQFSRPDGVFNYAGDNGPPFSEEPGTAPPAEARVAPDGTYVDGAQFSDTGQSLPEQVAQLGAAADAILDETAFGEPRDTRNAPQPQPVSGDGAPFGAIDGAAQIVSAGGNEVANVAAIYDLGDAFGSRIIRGDLHVKNVVVQINAIAEAPFDEATLLRAAVKSDSVLRNEASFSADAGALYALGSLGVPGAAHWQVDYVYGDLIDFTSVIQRNTLLDNDVVRTVQSTAHTVATLGENDQINVLNLVELGKQYDLIIVAGDFYKSNAVFQFNVVLDRDALAEIGGHASAASGGNQLTNDAAIIGIGGNAHRPLTADATRLADAIGARATTLDGAWTIGLPGDGDDTFDLLYVTGDYYVYNLVVQTNQIVDADVIVSAGHDGVALDAASGGNVATNTALIYDLDTQSAYQMLGGEAYEDSFLIQANIVIDADDDDRHHRERDDDDDDDSGLAAVLAAMSDDPVETGSFGASGSISTGHADLLGAVLH